MKIIENYQLGDNYLIQYQILQTNITRTVYRQEGESFMRPWELKGPSSQGLFQFLWHEVT